MLRSQADNALRAFHQSDISPTISDEAGSVQIETSVLPSHALEVVGIDENTSIKTLIESLKLTNVNILKVDRSAIAKVKRNLEVSVFEFFIILPIHRVLYLSIDRACYEEAQVSDHRRCQDCGDAIPRSRRAQDVEQNGV